MRRSSRGWPLIVGFFAVTSATAAATAPVSYRWDIALGGTGTDVATGIAVDPGGNILFTGVFDDSVDFDPGSTSEVHVSTGQRDGFVSKLTSSGGHIWTRTWGGSGIDWPEGVASGTDGSVLVTGRFQETVDFDPTGGVNLRTVAGDYDAFVLRLTSAGAYQWAWSVGSPGLDMSDGGFILVRDRAGDWLVCGAFHLTVDFDPSPDGEDIHTANGNEHDIFVTKLGADGSHKWTRTTGGPNVDVAWGVAVDTQNNIVLTGRFMESVDFDPGTGEDIHVANGENDVFITKLDSNGNHLWTRTFGGTNTDGGWRVAVDDQDAIYVTGWLIGPVDLDPTGGVDQTTGQDASDLFVVKLNASGSYAWGYRAGGSGNDEGKFLSITPDGTVLVTGTFQNQVDFDPDGQGDVRTTAGSSDAYVLALDRDGNYMWVLTLGGSGGSVRGQCIWPYQSDGFLIGGQFTGTIDLDPTGGVQRRTAAGQDDLFLVRMAITADEPDGSGDGDPGPGPVVNPSPMCAAGMVEGAALSALAMSVLCLSRRRR